MERLEARRTCSLPPVCRGCRELPYCAAGCSCDRVFTERTLQEPSAMCQDIKYILNFLRTEGADILKEQLTTQRDELLAQLEKA